MLKCFMTVILQLALCTLIMRASSDEVLKPWYGDFGEKFPTGNTTLNAARFLCTFLLHMSIMPEIRTSISMLKYSVNVAPRNINNDQSENF